MADEVQLTEIESKIKAAMFSRASYFREQADSLTFEGVRRLLEKDLGLETHKLDSHKRFVKHWLGPCIESVDSDKLPKNEDDASESVVSSTKEAKPMKGAQMKKEAEEPNSGSGEKMEDSPVMGLMTGHKYVKNETEDAKTKIVPSESMIKKAIWARASYLRKNCETVTMAGLRRLLEEDLELEKRTLDPFKEFINQQVDEVMESPDIPQTTASQKKKNLKKGASGKASSISSEEETPPSSESKGNEVEEDEVKVRKKSTPKGKLQKVETVRKRKKAEEAIQARKKQSKVLKSTSEGSSEEKDGHVSGDNDSEVSAEKPAKKKEAPKPGYGKKVEHLKSVIKSCGMSVPPTVYKRVKQAPDNKREACLIKELEEILAKEGLSSNPSEKEIKEVKKRKDRARELEGIDLGNIVSSSRRRSTTSFAPPPKPQIPDISESESEESENEDEEEEEGEEEVEEDQENGGNDSQSEESEQDNGDSD